MSVKNSLFEMNIISIIGCIIVLTGFLIPWFTLSYYTSEYRYRIHFYPLFLRVDDHEKLTLNLYTRQFTSPLNLGTIIISLICIFGVILGLVGGISQKGKFSGIGGIISILSIPLFISTLPGYYVTLKANRGGFISAIGAVFMMIAFFGSISISNLVIRVRHQLKLIDRSMNWSKFFWIQLQLLAIIGSIYCSYELFRIIYDTFTHGSIILNLGQFPIWFYKIELFLCLYAIVYWCSHLISSILKFVFHKNYQKNV